MGYVQPIRSNRLREMQVIEEYGSVVQNIKAEITDENQNR